MSYSYISKHLGLIVLFLIMQESPVYSCHLCSGCSVSILLTSSSRGARVKASYVSPSVHRGVDMLVQAAPANTRRWPNAGFMLAHRLRRWANISPVLGYRVMLGAMLNEGQCHRRWGNIYPVSFQSIVLVLSTLHKPTIDPAMCRCNIH